MTDPTTTPTRPSLLKRATSLVDGRDLFFFAGLCLLAWGAAQFSIPAAAIAAGCVLLFQALKG